jgi:hypothetical protein
LFLYGGIWLIYAGWWFQPTPLKNDGVKVSWDDEIPNFSWKVIKKIHGSKPPTRCSSRIAFPAFSAGETMNISIYIILMLLGGSSDI